MNVFVIVLNSGGASLFEAPDDSNFIINHNALLGSAGGLAPNMECAFRLPSGLPLGRSVHEDRSSHKMERSIASTTTPSHTP